MPTCNAPATGINLMTVAMSESGKELPMIKHAAEAAAVASVRLAKKTVTTKALGSEIAVAAAANALLFAEMKLFKIVFAHLSNSFFIEKLSLALLGLSEGIPNSAYKIIFKYVTVYKQ